MPTVGAKVSQKELDVIVEYANQCGETVSNLIRKVMIKEATLCDSFNDGHDYQYSMSMAAGLLGQQGGRLFYPASITGPEDPAISRLPNKTIYLLLASPADYLS